MFRFAFNSREFLLDLRKEALQFLGDSRSASDFTRDVLPAFEDGNIAMQHSKLKKHAGRCTAGHESFCSQLLLIQWLNQLVVKNIGSNMRSRQLVATAGLRTENALHHMGP